MVFTFSRNCRINRRTNLTSTIALLLLEIISYFATTFALPELFFCLPSSKHNKRNFSLIHQRARLAIYCRYYVVLKLRFPIMYLIIISKVGGVDGFLKSSSWGALNYTPFFDPWSTTLEMWMVLVVVVAPCSCQHRLKVIQCTC